MKTELTTEESQHLIDLGVPKELASISEDMYGPTLFALEDFLNGEILPKEIVDDTWGFISELGMRWYREVDSWLVGYNGNAHFVSGELIDALYQLACWYYGEYLKSEKK